MLTIQAGQMYRFIPVSYLDYTPRVCSDIVSKNQTSTNSSMFVKLENYDNSWRGEMNGLVKLKSRSCLILKKNPDTKTYLTVPFFSEKESRNQKNWELIQIKDPKFAHTFALTNPEGYFDFRYIRSVHSSHLDEMQRTLEPEVFSDINYKLLLYMFINGE